MIGVKSVVVGGYFLSVDDLEAAHVLDCLARALGGILREFGIGGDDRDRLGTRRGAGGEFEEAA